MGVTYRENPVSLALINPGKPPRKKAGGQTVAAKKKKKAAKKSSPKKMSATKRKAPARKKGMKTALPASVKKAVTTASKAATTASNAADKAEKAAKKAASSVNTVAERAATKAAKAVAKKSAPKPARKKAAAPKKRKSAAKKSTKKSKKRSPAQKAATAKLVAMNKAKAKKKAVKKAPAKKKSSKKRTSAQKAATRRMIAANKAKRKSSAKKGAVRKPRKPPTALSKPRYDYSRKKKAGKRQPGYYPISGYNVGPHWAYYKNPGVKVMPNGTILDPVSKKFVSPTSARGRQLMKGASWSNNPMGRLAGFRANPTFTTVETTMKHAASVGIGFFGARAMANIASMSPMVPAPVAPYAPFVAQVATGFLVYAAGERIESFKQYQASAMAGVGLSIIEALINRFAPDMVQEYTAVPDPGLGDDLLTYRRALSAYEGLNEGWNDYYPGDEAILNAMGEYVLPEDLDPVFDVDPMGEYVLSEDLDPEFDVEGGMGEYVLTEDIDPALEAIGGYDAAQQEALYQVGMGDVFSTRARNQIAMGEYVSVDDLDPAYDFWGGMGATDDAVIGGVYGAAQGGGMFGTAQSNMENRAMAIASAAIQAAKATGASPQAASKDALAAVVKELRIPRYQARRIVLQAMRTVFRGGRGPAMQPVAPAPSVPEVLPPEQDDSEFRTGMFAEGMFDPSDDD